MLIKEMAARLQITPRAIRYYEEKGLIKPQKADESGYRHFTEEDVWKLQTVVTLREVGMQIEDIRLVMEKMEDQQGSLLHHLELQRSVLYSRWVEMSKLIQTTETMIERVKHDGLMDAAALYELAEGNKRLRQTRDNWVDRWNFDQIADHYDELVLGEREGFNPHENYDYVLNTVVAAVNPQEGEQGLDAGIGTGNLASRFARPGIHMCGFDQSLQMLQRCREKHPFIPTKLGTFFAIPFLKNGFDFVVTSYAMNHLTDEQKLLALGEINRVLKPGGRLVIADLMFVDQEERERHLQALRDAGEEEAIRMIEDKWYADRSRLIEGLQDMGFEVQAKRLTRYVHLLLAKPR